MYLCNLETNWKELFQSEKPDGESYKLQIWLIVTLCKFAYNQKEIIQTLLNFCALLPSKILTSQSNSNLDTEAQCAFLSYFVLLTCLLYQFRLVLIGLPAGFILFLFSYVMGKNINRNCHKKDDNMERFSLIWYYWIHISIFAFLT